MHLFYLNTQAKAICETSNSTPDLFVVACLLTRLVGGEHGWGEGESFPLKAINKFNPPNPPSPEVPLRPLAVKFPLIQKPDQR